MSPDSPGSSSAADPLGPIIESFLARLRRGQHPSIKDYATRYPEHAPRILRILPPLAEMELAAMAANASLHFAAGADGSPGAPGDRGTASSPADRDGAPGFERLGDYRIIREIGSGGMGTVYEAEREALHSRVALKVMHANLRNQPDHLRWFLREAQTAAGLHHTNIVSVFDYGQHDGVCYYAMQFIAGHSLDRVMADVKRLKRQAERAPDADRTLEAPAARRAAGEATLPDARAPDAELRSVCMGLVTGVFRPEEHSSIDGLEATDPGAGASHGDLPRLAPLSEACRDSPSGPREQSADSGASAGLSVTPVSSWSGKSSLRYQREIARIGFQVADALDHAHKRNVIHRDIKPHNILLDALGNAWITDFGLAKLKEAGNQTTSQAFAGTLRYMAPERFQGKSDGRDDVYALGATLYEFLALRPVFDTSDPHQLLSRIEHDPPTPLRSIDRRIHPDIAAVVARALAKDPCDRYAGAAELRDELRRFMEGRPVRTRPVPPHAQFWRWCRRNPWLAAANIAAAVLTTALAVGSSIGWKFYYDYSQKLTQAGADKDRSEREARKQLVEAQSERARSWRVSRRQGQRFEALDAVKKASDVGNALGLPAESFARLRDEAIAAMALPDMKPDGPPIQQPDGTIAFAFDEGMTRYAFRLRDGTILVHRMSDGQEIERFRVAAGSDSWVFAFSPDGRYLAFGDGPSNTLSVWDIDRKVRCVHDPKRLSQARAGFSPDSRRIAVGHDDGSLSIHDVQSGKQYSSWRSPAASERLAYRPDGKQIAICYWEDPPSCRIVDVETDQEIHRILIDAPGPASWSPDGRTLAIPGKDSSISLWDASAGQRMATLEGATSRGINARFHPSGTLLISNGWEGRLRLWDAVLGRQILNVSGFDGIEFSREGQIFLLRGNEHTPWRVEPALEYRTFAHVSNPPPNYARPSIHREGRMLAVGTDQGVVLWDLARGTELAFLPIGLAWHSMFDVSGDFLTNGDAGFWRWPVRLDQGGERIQVGPPRRLPLPGSHCGIDEDRTGRIVAVARQIAVDVAVGERTIAVGPLHDCRGVSISPDGQWLATGSHSSTDVIIWKLPEASPVKTLQTEVHTAAYFSQNGRWLVTENSPYRLYEVGTWHEVRRAAGTFRCFSPDGRLAIVLDADSVLNLIEIETGRTLARLESPDTNAEGMATFSPDGARLVVATKGPPPCVHVWDLRAIRRQLIGMGLDWDAPAFSDEDAARAELAPLPPLEVDFGPLSAYVKRDPDRP
jgi:serine/threonine protein kinase/WD40 repeat protein